MYTRLLGLGVRLVLLRVQTKLRLPQCVNRLVRAPLGDVSLDLGHGTAWLSAATWDIDCQVCLEVFVFGIFRADYEGSVVIDLGGHRGYFAGYALLSGAAHVYSFEPHSGNYASLVRTLCTFDPTRYRWTAYRCAVGNRDGEVDLLVSSESWSHSIYQPHSGRLIGSERVQLKAFPAILRAIQEAHPSRAIVVKINIEGAAGDVILAAPVHLWQSVAQVLFDYEPTTPHPVDELVRHLQGAGLQRVSRQGNRIVKLRRR